ncbi:DNA-binding CsgD family transcriptional regulator [Allocatelliglobosispora scoriae]|uniref:DNA-binding CsgD family transcriptional regulator n=1 Tax=Allocatelliglobosispora scoriae TaxID=643052 RepID=A0A841BNL5_9ACTN|nr:helix-turn-helix transcriptional regulator [Allocatelliglobosispora scoriae]MBB5868789.1 DNA-binding CsgD family transcriptional regulator [Allocatelliglobosispora scoriae]
MHNVINAEAAPVKWGVSSDAVLVFRALRMSGSQPLQSLAHDIGMTGRRTAAAIDELRDIQAVALAHGRWSASDPAAVSAVVLGRRTAALARRSSPAIASATVLATGDSSDRHTLRHLNRDATRHRLGELVGVARHEHLVMSPELVFDAAAMAAASSSEATLISRRVHIRAMYRPGASHDTGPPPPPQAEHRTTADLRLKLFVVDRRVALFPVDPGELDRGYLEATDPALVEALVAAFERSWSCADDPWETVVPELALSPREQVLVGLLRSGHTDASAAREMRLSERSVTNIVRSLMDRLGVENRFQLGLALGGLRITQVPEGTKLLIDTFKRQQTESESDDDA